MSRAPIINGMMKLPSGPAAMMIIAMTITIPWVPIIEL